MNPKLRQSSGSIVFKQLSAGAFLVYSSSALQMQWTYTGANPAYWLLTYFTVGVGPGSLNITPGSLRFQAFGFHGGTAQIQGYDLSNNPVTAISNTVNY